MFRIIVYDENFRASKVEMKITIYVGDGLLLFSYRPFDSLTLT